GQDCRYRQSKEFPSQGVRILRDRPSSVVQHTTVNIYPEMPKDHFIWSLCCFLYSNPFCLGLAALIHSARDRKVMGDIEGARGHGMIARILNIMSTVIFCVFVSLIIIVFNVHHIKP
uniref:Uncharacterized protein n=1 Tax=Neogobius melanostomus TaxID=47308 RepID=A0A8C6SF23_9GOBI